MSAGSSGDCGVQQVALAVAPLRQHQGQGTGAGVGDLQQIQERGHHHGVLGRPAQGGAQVEHQIRAVGAQTQQEVAEVALLGLLDLDEVTARGEGAGHVAGGAADVAALAVTVSDAGSQGQDAVAGVQDQDAELAGLRGGIELGIYTHGV